MINSVQIDKAKATGKIVANLDNLADACDSVGFPFFMGLTILQKESSGRNVYGNDSGGALAGFKAEVTQGNYEVFRWLVDVKKMASNGVGPMQITWSGYFPDMVEKKLDPWDPKESILYSVKYILDPKFRASRATLSDRLAFKATAKAYNGSEQYAVSALTIADQWVAVVGTQDTLVKW